MYYEPGSIEVSKILPKDIIGHTVGNFEILARAGNGRVRAKCLKCGNDKYENQWYKIKSGHSRTCGCAIRITNPEQYIGEKHSKLTIVSIMHERDKDGAMRCRVLCKCGNKVSRRLNEILRGKIKSCGCLGNTRKGNSAGANKRLYDVWRQMMCRCYQDGSGNVTTNPNLKFLNNPNEHPRYYGYGGRGIKVYSGWHDLAEFVMWHNTNIRVGESMDRVDNDGNYSPGNVNSATVITQNINQRVRKDNKIGYKGIRDTGHSYRWYVKYHGKEVGKEGFRSVFDALVERNIYIVENKLPHKVQAPREPHELRIDNYCRGYCITMRELVGIDTIRNNTIFSNKNDPVLINTFRLMKEAWVRDNEIDGDYHPSPYLGVSWTKHSYKYTINHKGIKYAKEGYDTYTTAYLERTIRLIKEGLPNENSKLEKHCVAKVIDDAKSGLKIIEVSNDDMAIGRSITGFKETDPLLEKVLEKIIN
jgi:hypothetical protein